MIWLLAQLTETEREQALAKGWWNLSFILLVGAIAVLFLIAMILLRRWKHKQLQAIEEDRAERRAGKSAERVDAWSASAERYVDHDKLAPDDEPFGHQSDREPGEDQDDGYLANEDDTPPDDRDPFGLFDDKPYQDLDDEDDFDDDDEDDDEDWDEADEDEDDKR